MRLAFCSLALILAASGCRDDVAAPPITALDGTWDRLDEIPGSAEHWSLALSGTAVSGTGTWSGEACCGGPLTIAGIVVRDSVHLSVTMAVTVGNPAPDHHERFDGRLISATELHGTVTLDGGMTGAVRLRKQ